jgi:predicted ATPase/transcriptional regulator with XRE-family HTH domain
VNDLAEHTLARTLRSLRLSAGLTQEELAERCGISARTISDVERGLRSKVYPSTARRLASALNLGEEERLRVFGSLQGSAGGPGPERAPGLPVPPTPMLGRSHELRLITEAITGSSYRLVTLTGPGGVGKTRLALEAARLNAFHFPEGVCFVSLGELAGSSLVPIAVARALGAVISGDEPQSSIARHLSQGRYLIVLDTFEHVLGAASLVHSLLLECPGTSFLVTSRTALRLRGEQEFQIPPLELPPASGDDPELGVGSWPATALFVQRALAVKPQLSIDPASSRLIVDICRRLEGLPLAIELAASRVKHFPLEALRAQLDHRLELLVRGAVDFPPRQRTMRDTVAWSHDLLDPHEQVLYRRLSVFVGGWDLEAIKAVCEVEAGMDTLSSLLDKSLIFLAGDGPTARYDMLDVIREYGGEVLSKAGERDQFSEKHAIYFLGLAENAEARLVTADQSAWMVRLEAEHNNMRRALGWLIARRDTQAAMRFVVALWRYWRHSGQLVEGRRWCETAIALSGECPPSLRAKAYWGTAALAFPQGDYKRMSELASMSLEFARESEDPMDLRNAHTMVGLVALVEGRYKDALLPLREALSLCRNLGQTWQLATSHLNLGLALLHSGDLTEAETVLREGLKTYIELGDETFAARTKVTLSHLEMSRGNNSEGQDLARAALATFASTQEPQGTAEALVTIAALKAAAGERQSAAELHGAAAALRETIAARPAPFDDAIPNRLLEKAREGRESAWEAAWSKGSRLSLEAAVETALGQSRASS